MLFSIIVPVYKVEQYIGSCLSSVLNQSFQDYEVILVDDGSPDQSGRICDEYAEKDRRIRVLHKKNGGPSSARNAGLDAAAGDFVFFLDSDDEMCEDCLQTVSAAIREYPELDVLVGNTIHRYPDRLSKNVEYRELMTDGPDSLPKICERFASRKLQIPWAPYQSICRRSLIEQHHLRFKENLITAEDCAFFLSLCALDPRAKLFDFCTVLYRTAREDSLIHTVSYRSVMGQLETFYDACGKAGMFSDSALMKSYFASRYANIIILVQGIPDREDRNRCYRYIEDRKEILKDCFPESRYLMARTVWNLFGFEKGSKLLAAVNQWRKRVR